jgi:hypothetical protein
MLTQEKEVLGGRGDAQELLWEVFLHTAQLPNLHR